MTIGNGLYLPGRIGEGAVNFLVDTGSGVFYCSSADLETVGMPEGRANEVLGTTILGGRTSVGLPGTSEACCKHGSTGHHLGLHSGEIGEDEGILGNDFAMAHRLKVRPHEAAVYLPRPQDEGEKT